LRQRGSFVGLAEILAFCRGVNWRIEKNEDDDLRPSIVILAAFFLISH
jgi:hypothetical protein